ncbi:DEAD/DEAH box helicase [Sphingopyxis panaciterrae]
MATDSGAVTTTAIAELARNIRAEFATDRLTPTQAKLYSQRIRHDMGRSGLASFGSGEAQSRLEEAMLLLEVAWIERDAGNAEWHSSAKRAAEILEWLSHSGLRPPGVPMHLLAAAAYQLAGYPAMALGLLQRFPSDDRQSVLLRSFLRADFPAALAATQAFWTRSRYLDEVDEDGDGTDEGPPTDVSTSPDGVVGPADSDDPESTDGFDDELDDDFDGLEDLSRFAREHVVMCLGTICAYMRTGDDALVERAVTKLDALAAGFLHSRDPYSYLLAKLTAAVARDYVKKSLWPHVEALSKDTEPRVGAALTQFVRAAYMNRRALIWPAQAQGISRLAQDGSFVLCTPTGSGKTMIATLGAVQGLFANSPNPFQLSSNIVLYLVPSRALAAEVEARLAEDLRGIAAERVVVTGLYGGIDWGPTDAWIDIDQPAVLVCTFEKADALLRYLGILFLDRVRTVIIDEAHMVEQDEERTGGLQDGTSRSLRLEQLSTRLLRARDEKGFRLIALSAVAAKAAPAIANWLGDDVDGGDSPIVSAHRSTRQMLGRLEVAPSGRFDIRYDLMDGHSLEFADERADDRPFVPSPFPPLPGGIDEQAGPGLRLRAPTLWAALHLAAARPDGTKPTVLVSITQHIVPFAETCAALMEEWEEESLPNYWDVDESDPNWQRCLAAAADYFSKKSFEYRLLKKGIAVHHGQMPALLARRLKVAIDHGHVRVIIATSTLSEGVNLPVSTILLPAINRADAPMPLAEFANLIGRAGRPGVSTEGSALVMVPVDDAGDRMWSRNWGDYDQLIGELEAATIAVADPDTTFEVNASSGIALLLEALRGAWGTIAGASGSDAQFEAWLAATAVDDAALADEKAANYLDTFDGMLLAFIEEVETLTSSDMTGADLETELKRIWRRTYAHAASGEEARLENFWLARGKVIKIMYPDAERRRELYRTSLNPRSGELMLENVDGIRDGLIAGTNYSDRSKERQFEFVGDILEMLSKIPAFAIGTTLGQKKNFEDWQKILRWWLFKSSLGTKPTPKELAKWYKFVSDNFLYRGSWGLGSVVGLLLERGKDGEAIDALQIDDWPKSGLPWIAFWLKELIAWGTLDPVAAFLLARGDAVDRSAAEEDAKAYYDGLGDDVDANERINPRTIRDWVESLRPLPIGKEASVPSEVTADLARPAGVYSSDKLNVHPIEVDGSLQWIDPAGYFVASSALPDNWTATMARDFQFDLTVGTRSIAGDRYRPHHY